MLCENWKGCFVSESLKNPKILNELSCYKIKITGPNLPIDEKGTLGRWHMYWIETPNPPIELFKGNMLYNWYGHFWKENEIIAIFEGAVFTLNKNDKETWKDAIEYGKSQGILETQLDFLTD
ncbi:MAG: hypothetical protein PQJ59_13770 [Spirochaetales bacterium]|nr:hypothetical protein [Spirochaetales bacterium]